MRLETRHGTVNVSVWCITISTLFSFRLTIMRLIEESYYECVIHLCYSSLHPMNHNRFECLSFARIQIVPFKWNLMQPQPLAQVSAVWYSSWLLYIDSSLSTTQISSTFCRCCCCSSYLYFLKILFFIFRFCPFNWVAWIIIKFMPKYFGSNKRCWPHNPFAPI